MAPAASDTARMWRLLDPQKQAILVNAVPHVVGNLEGIPYSVRGKANAVDLKQTIKTATAELRSIVGAAHRAAGIDDPA